jgi:hypothetical protein
LKRIEERIDFLARKFAHMENKERAEALIAEAKKLGSPGDYDYTIDGYIVRLDIMSIAGTHRYQLERFDCDVLCPLRKKRLAELEINRRKSKKAGKKNA